MPNARLVIDETMTLLAENPRRVIELTRGLTPAQLRQAPGRDEWSANELLAHLRCCADVWGGYIARIVDEDVPKIRAVSPRGWMKRTDYQDLEFHTSMHAFAAQRDSLLGLLGRLTVDGWRRTARVTRSGRVSTETVLSYAERLAEHERHHLDQFVRILNVVKASQSV